ncbi:16S rRNA (cytidine1402-2'-O)-methyltransferase [Sediminihabitans luteus]|uniref:Ribosomal RNA small subunit methyltransferase I n=1 Tax=Sediminihabitans luteus TaxID=1138585 RepID=A0A2M9CE39_9CELL|nr:16S rRNA (cytidine(1402)-2'-O)-methyltransferase [Sediminihabitans luteus]PJJ70120.1 16S rRNA (cytidine1402-2'-O)-methyltransferase [Sediminihabitans luteus]GIJ00579.1 ribosomal RNA small subunit methyltransferase I [Sediminihabitans luteus]
MTDEPRSVPDATSDDAHDDATAVPRGDAPARGLGAGGRTGGALVLAATPIGNADDASARLRRLLAEAEVVAAEDTRRLHALAARLGLTVGGRVVSYHEHNEAERADELLDVVEGGGVVAIVTDAGMPSVSDPGYRVVTRAVERDLPVTAAPGPSAVLTALALSGLPTDRFCFEGFPPRKPGERSRAFEALAREPRTMVFFEAPHRIDDTLAAMAVAFGAERPAAVCRELTKTYEQVLRGPLAELAERAAGEQLRGEICVVVAGAPAREQASEADLVAEVLARADAGERLKDAVAAVAEAAGTSKRELYGAALAARKR